MFHTDKLEGILIPKTAQVCMLAGGETQGLKYLLDKNIDVDKLHRIDT